MWPNPDKTVDLLIFTAEILNGKLHFLCTESRTNFTNIRGSISVVFLGILLFLWNICYVMMVTCTIKVISNIIIVLKSLFSLLEYSS